MNEREKILGRIREALKVKASRPGDHGDGQGTARFTGRPVEGARDWLPPGGDTFEEQAARFQTASTELKTDFRLLNSIEEVRSNLAALSTECGWKTVATHVGELTDQVVPSLGLPVLKTDGGYDVRALEKCDVGITGCDLLVAQTGSVLVTNRSAGGRALSVLPPHHLVLARRTQMVPDLATALQTVQKRYGSDYPSMISFITGPSRTGDIERILVLGAHGPKKLTVLVF